MATETSRLIGQWVTLAQCCTWFLTFRYQVKHGVGSQPDIKFSPGIGGNCYRECVFVVGDSNYRQTFKITFMSTLFSHLTHWGRETHICDSKLCLWTYYDLLSIEPQRQTPMTMTFDSKYNIFYSRKSIWKCRLQNVGRFRNFNVLKKMSNEDGKIS